MSDEVGVTAGAFARLAQELHGEHGVTETVEAVVRFALQVIGCESAGVLLTGSNRSLWTVTVTDPMIELVDQLQLASGTGPAFSIVAKGHDSLVVADSLAEKRWAAWSTGIAELGLRSALVVGLGRPGAMLGVLQLFDLGPYAFGPEDQRIASVLARHASIAVASALREASLWREAADRKQLGQAQGILMERFGIDAPRAAEILRLYSDENHVQLRDVAHQLSRRRRTPESRGGTVA
ncbi:GAF and ANTAR domain-containing protein [Kribbella sancticallisti]|uniref:GAF and ANTAR domain-containing protein n=1 Tax=Kribbella sancticallisti TaxID=460087 RepID=A0ABN2DX47_9ACTN